MTSKHYSAPSGVSAPATDTLVRLPEVLRRVPVSRSTWLLGVATGRFPKPVKLGPRTTAWRASDIADLVEKGSAL